MFMGLIGKSTLVVNENGKDRSFGNGLRQVQEPVEERGEGGL
jgi:hypothetical protein